MLPMLKETDFDLIIAGEKNSSYAQEILEEAAKLGISKRVILPGSVSEDEKMWLYQHCEAFLFPSIAEGFGLPVIEAMSFGKPVFLSPYTSLPEVGGPHAYYFSDFEAPHMIEVLTKGLEDYRLIPQRKTDIQQWAAKFSWDVAAREYLQIYSSLM
jgi:glycosyltransferase involved in cell wall biosynthesis